MTRTRWLALFWHSAAILTAAAGRPVLAQDGISNPGLPAISAANEACRIAWPANPSTDQAVDIHVLLRVNADGRVSDTKIVVSSGYREFDKAAIISVSRCRFEPALQDGVPAASWFTFKHTWLPDRKAVLEVSKEGFQIFGQTITSREELIKALLEHHTEFVEIHTDDSQDYEQIGRAIYTITRSGAEMKVFTKDALKGK